MPSLLPFARHVCAHSVMRHRDLVLVFVAGCRRRSQSVAGWVAVASILTCVQASLWAACLSDVAHHWHVAQVVASKDVLLRRADDDMAISCSVQQLWACTDAITWSCVSGSGCLGRISFIPPVLLCRCCAQSRGPS